MQHMKLFFQIGVKSSNLISLILFTLVNISAEIVCLSRQMIILKRVSSTYAWTNQKYLWSPTASYTKASNYSVTLFVAVKERNTRMTITKSLFDLCKRVIFNTHTIKYKFPFWKKMQRSILPKYEDHKVSFQTFFVWALLLIVHTWNSSPLRGNLLRLQCTCCTVPTTSGRPHGSPLVWACQWPSSQPLSSPQLSHNDSLWA